MKSHHCKSSPTLSQKNRTRKTLTSMCIGEAIRTKEVEAEAAEVAGDPMDVDSEVEAGEVVPTKMDAASFMINLELETIIQETAITTVVEVAKVEEQVAAGIISTAQILMQATQLVTQDSHLNHALVLDL